MSRPPARPARRVLALLILLLVAGAMAAAVRATRAPDRPSASLAVATGGAFPVIAVPRNGTDTTRWSAATEAGHPFLVLYYADSCPHCRVELARWDSIAARHRVRAGLPRVIIVRAPARPGTVPHPTRMADVVLHDRQGALARALRLRAVPVWYAVDRRGLILAAHTGVTPPELLEATFIRLGRGDTQ